MLNREAKYIWLASYPKSGNTWLRIFLSALIADGLTDINDLETNLIISSRQLIDATLGLSSSDIPEVDYLQYRSAMYHRYALQYCKEEYLLCKVHDACTLNGHILFPPSITRATIYILRNPFDMAASMAHHHNVAIDKAVNMLCDNTHSLASKKIRLNTQISQYLGTWSNHIQSWTNVHRNNILLVKYEDMLNNSLPAFTNIVRYIGLQHTADEIQQAIEAAAFDKLQSREKEVGFRLNPRVEQFFRKGRIGEWRNEITQSQADHIIDCNYESLLKYGYIDAAGNILV